MIHCRDERPDLPCESEPDKARFINRESSFFLSGLAQDIPFVFFSTDLVFNGNHGQYTEQDEPSPLTIYARTKAEAEQLVLANPLHTVVRTSLTAGTSPSGSRGIDEQLINQWQKGNSPTLFTDEFRCPIHADATARAIWELVQAKQTGIYHLAGGERMSRYEIGQAIARTQSGLRMLCNSGQPSGLSGAAPRGGYLPQLRQNPESNFVSNSESCSVTGAAETTGRMKPYRGGSPPPLPATCTPWPCFRTFGAQHNAPGGPRAH